MRACWLKWVGRDWSISADYIWLNYSDANRKGTFGGKHTEIVYLKDITGVNRIKGRDVFLRNRLLTACVFSLSSRAKAQEFVNALNMVM